MGFGDRLKGLRDQAQQAVADNKDKIQGAVQNVGEAANTRTRGKYADKITKVGDKVSGGVEKFAQGEGGAPDSGGASDSGGAPDSGGASDSGGAPVSDAPVSDAPVGGAPGGAPAGATDGPAAGSPPEFE